MRVYKWISVGKKKYGLVNKHKVEDAVFQASKEGKPSDLSVAQIYDRRGGLVVDAKLTPVTGVFEEQ